MLLMGILVTLLMAAAWPQRGLGAGFCYFPQLQSQCTSYGSIPATSPNWRSSPAPTPQFITGQPWMFNQNNGTSKRIDRRNWADGSGSLQNQWFGSVQNFQVPVCCWASAQYVCVNIAGGTVNVRCGYVY